MDQEVSIELNKKKKREYGVVNGESPMYMIIFYGIVGLIVFSMIFHFCSILNLSESVGISNVTSDAITAINDMLPYDKLIIALIVYCFAMFGIEGTRSVILSLEVKDISEKAKNMPPYKRNRLLQMLVTFILLSILAMLFQMKCVQITPKANFHLDAFYSGIGVFLPMLGYADFGPKLGNTIGKYLNNKNTENATEENSTTDDSKK